MARFSITGGKGFYFGFPNGWGVSVQFGPGNYADNYDMRISSDDAEAGRRGSDTAECALISPAGDLTELPEFMFEPGGYRDFVSNRSSPEDVLKLLNFAQSKEAA